MVIKNRSSLKISILAMTVFMLTACSGEEDADTGRETALGLRLLFPEQVFSKTEKSAETNKSGLPEVVHYIMIKAFSKNTNAEIPVIAEGMDSDGGIWIAEPGNTPSKVLGLIMANSQDVTFIIACYTAKNQLLLYLIAETFFVTVLEDNMIEVQMEANPDPHNRCVDFDNDGYGMGPRDCDTDGCCIGWDNCPFIANFTQADTNEDGIGDVCEPTRNRDWSPAADRGRDGIADQLDNCPDTFNPFQADADGDGYGDACDCNGNYLVTEEPGMLGQFPGYALVELHELS